MTIQRTPTELIVEVDLEEGCYSFWVAGVHYDPAHNAYRVATDSGCSCSYPWEYHPEDSEPPVGLAEAIKLFRAELTDYVNLDAREEAINDLREHAKSVGARP